MAEEFWTEPTRERLGFTAKDFGPRIWRAVGAEFIATLLFVAIGAGTVVTSIGILGGEGAGPSFVTTVALAHGLAIAVFVSATAKVSGGHINPAVTLAAVLTQRTKLSTGILYVAAQVLGGVLGALLLKAVFADAVEGNLGAHSLNRALVPTDQLGLLVEIILTFALVYVIFATAMDPRGLAHLAPFAIGSTILIDHLIGVPLTGASMNPARSFGPSLVANFWDNHWIYWVGPFIGGSLAGLTYYFSHMWRREEEAA